MKRTFKRKDFFWGQELTIKFVALFMLKTNDFTIQLKPSVCKQYMYHNVRMSYKELLDIKINNIESWDLQLHYIGKEWGVYKGKELIKTYLLMRETYTKEILEEKYLKEKQNMVNLWFCV